MSVPTGDLTFDPDAIVAPRHEKFPSDGTPPWLDRADAEAQVAQRVRDGKISESEAAQLLFWRDNGYIVVERAIDSITLDEVWAAYEAAGAAGVIQLNPEPAGENDPWPGRALDPHLKVPEICRVMRHSEILRWVQLLMDAIPAPFQTITSHKGSQQGVHSDSIHMTTYPLGYLSAAWIAFEDMHPDCGPLIYYPGSHRLPYLFSHHLGVPEDDFARNRYDSYLRLYEPRIRETIRERDLKPHYFLAKKGDVLFWHANLLHGGSIRRDLRWSRRALVCHYFVEGAVCYHDLSASHSRPFSGTCLVESAGRG